MVTMKMLEVVMVVTITMMVMATINVSKLEVAATKDINNFLSV